MCLIKSWRDVEEGSWGEVGVMRMLLQKDMAFLPLCKHVDTQICRVKRMLSHIPVHSLSLSLSLFLFLSWTQSQSHTRRKKKRSGSVPSLSGKRPWGRARGERKTQLLFPAPNLQLLPMKREAVQLDSIVDRQHGYPDSGTPKTSSAVGAAQICTCNSHWCCNLDYDRTVMFFW